MLDQVQHKLNDLLRGIRLTIPDNASIEQQNTVEGINILANMVLASPFFQSNQEAIINIVNDEFDKVKEAVKYEGGEHVLKMIEENISLGNIVNAASHGVSDRINIDGILKNHAYSVLGITRHPLYEGGPELAFVRLRNPHGQTGCEYHVNPDTKEITRHSARLREEGGIFEIELKDFCHDFFYVYVNFS